MIKVPQQKFIGGGKSFVYVVMFRDKMLITLLVCEKPSAKPKDSGLTPIAIDCFLNI